MVPFCLLCCNGTIASATIAQWSWTARELFVNCSLTCCELLVNVTWAVREISMAVLDSRGMARTGTHPPASSRHVQEQFAHSSRPGREILSWPKFWTFQNSCPDMARSHDGFTHTSHQFTTSLRTGTTRALARLESCQCVPQNRTSVSLALDHNKLATPFSLHILVYSIKTLNPFPNKPWILHVCSTSLLKKGIARNEQFLLFPPCFIPVGRTFSHFNGIWNGCLQTLSI